MSWRGGGLGMGLVVSGMMGLGCGTTPAPIDYRSPSSQSIDLKGRATVVVESNWVDGQKGGVAEGQNFVVTVRDSRGVHPIGKGFLAGRTPLGAKAEFVGNELVVRLFNANSGAGGGELTIRTPNQGW